MNSKTYLKSVVESVIQEMIYETTQQSANSQDIRTLRRAGVRSTNLTTYGQLKTVLNKERNRFTGKQALKRGLSVLGNVLSSGLGDVAIDVAGAVGIEGVKSWRSGKARKKASTRLDKINTKKFDKLNIDPYTAEIVDDIVENNFIKEFYKFVMSQPDDKPLEDFFDIDFYFTEYLKRNYNGRYVDYDSNFDT